MSFTSHNDPVLERLDAIAEATGVPTVSRWASERRRNHHARRRIVLPILAIIASLICFIAAMGGHAFAMALAVFPFLFAAMVQQFGPIRLRDMMNPYDERERAMIASAQRTGFGVALALAVLGCGAFGLYDALHDAQHAGAWRLPPGAALSAMWLLLTVASGVTTITASRALPPPVDDADDDAGEDS